MSLGMMRTDHPRWPEFAERLSGPEGCDVREDPDGKLTWKCTSHTRELASAIRRDMGATDRDLLLTFDYLSARGGYCDCEILLNVAAPLHET